MTKKSGLADSPLFLNPSKPLDSAENRISQKKKETYTLDSKKAKSEPKRTDAQVYKRTSVQKNKRTDVQMNKRTSVQDFRPTKRNAYTLYLEQIHFIEDEVVRRSRQTGESVGISEVMRDIVEYYISKKKK